MSSCAICVEMYLYHYVLQGNGTTGLMAAPSEIFFTREKSLIKSIEKSTTGLILKNYHFRSQTYMLKKYLGTDNTA